MADNGNAAWGGYPAAAMMAYQAQFFFSEAANFQFALLCKVFEFFIGSSIDNIHRDTCVYKHSIANFGENNTFSY